MASSDSALVDDMINAAAATGISAPFRLILAVERIADALERAVQQRTFAGDVIAKSGDGDSSVQSAIDSISPHNDAAPSPVASVSTSNNRMNILEARIAPALDSLAEASHRIAAHIVSEHGDVVGTPCLAQQLGCSVVWVAEMARNGEIPKGCIVPGTGNGKPWKFYRQRIEEWINKR